MPACFLPAALRCWAAMAAPGLVLSRLCATPTSLLLTAQGLMLPSLPSISKRVHSELTALKAAVGEPHLAQCLGVFPSQRPDGKMALVIVTE